MENTEKDIITIVRKFYLTIQKYGYKKVLDKLNELNLPTFNKYENNIQNKILNLVVVEYECTEAELTKSNVRGDLGEARAMCIVLFKKYLNVSHKKIALIFKRQTHSMVSSALSQHKNKSQNISGDFIYIKKYNKIEKRLITEIDKMMK